MSWSRRIVPHPRLSLVLLVIWLWLNASFAPGQLVLGAIVALTIPWFTHRFWPEQTRLRRPLVLVPFAARVALDIVVANFTFALTILGPNRALRPHFVAVPVELSSDFALVALAQVISLTPGTVSAEISADRRQLVVHSLSTDDPEALVASIKQRYERPLKELFGC